MSKEEISLVVQILATLALFGQVLLVFSVSTLFLRKLSKNNQLTKKVVQFITPNFLAFGFIIAVIATLGSLFLSEVAHFTPCKLCWFQRIFMYPQVLLLGIAAFKNDSNIRKYIIPMSVVGIIIATYHYLLQMSPLPLPCTDELANCSLKQVAPYGYITIPMMSLTAYLLILFLMLFPKLSSTKRS